MNTAHDKVVYDFDPSVLSQRVQTFCENYNAEVDRFARAQKVMNTDDFVKYTDVKWSFMLKRKLERGKNAGFDADKIRVALYRPFTKKHLFFDDVLIDARGDQVAAFPPSATGQDNTVIVMSDLGFRSPLTTALVTGCVADMHLCATTDLHQCFPFYVYDEQGTNRWENVTDWALEQFRARYKDKKIGKWDIFYYVYGVLHHPGYREKFADNLKRELPRIPFAPLSPNGGRGAG